MNRLALKKTARRVLKELVPKVETDFQQSLAMIYPIVFVLKEGGYAMEARAFFEKVVLDPYEDCKEAEITTILSIYKPLTILLDLSDRRSVDDATLRHYLAWVRKGQGLCFGAEVNSILGRLGRCADSLSAEICLLLAEKLDRPKDRDLVLIYGQRIAANADIFNRRHGWKLAQKQAHVISLKLKAAARELQQNMISV